MSYRIILAFLLLSILSLSSSKQSLADDSGNSTTTECNDLSSDPTYSVREKDSIKKLLAVRDRQSPTARMIVYLQEGKSCRSILSWDGYTLYFLFKQGTKYPGIVVYHDKDRRGLTRTYFKWDGANYQPIDLIASSDLNGRALNLFRQGKTKEAISIWEQAAALTLVPGLELSADAEVLNNLGFAYYKMGRDQFPKAEEHLKGAAEVDPLRWSVRLNLGDLYFDTNNHENAIKNYKALLNLKPDNKYRDKIIGRLRSLKAAQKHALKGQSSPNTVTDPLAAYTAEMMKNYGAPENLQVIRVVKDFNNDGLTDVALTEGLGSAGGEWKLYLQDGRGRYEFVEELFFHPMAIAIIPLERGTSKIVTYSRSSVSEGLLTEALMSDFGMVVIWYRGLQPGSEGKEEDKKEYERLFGNLQRISVSECCRLTDYLNHNCQWREGYSCR